jgi:nucleotide-binding universal stress UspA family protein
LALPAGDRAIICSVLIAFDGSLASHRAVQAFARLLWPERVSVTVVMSHPEEAYRERALEMVEAYLRSHALSEIRTVGTEAEIRGVLEADYLERSDLVVAGMHAKHWIKDFFVGSLTRKLIDHGETALLLA